MLIRRRGDARRTAQSEPSLERKRSEQATGCAWGACGSCSAERLCSRQTGHARLTQRTRPGPLWLHSPGSPCGGFLVGGIQKNARKNTCPHMPLWVNNSVHNQAVGIVCESRKNRTRDCVLLHDKIPTNMLEGQIEKEDLVV